MSARPGAPRTRVGALPTRAARSRNRVHEGRRASRQRRTVAP
ncbi:hypothetical protein RAJCM14343_1076 [Rhodococcus aetherivorans]|uniref:Uncharacterized protein n=1 Tax=Rhodococcus aetherivorans TaxID=191292 RepID=A0ABQ0YH18_9NOCA|nr:hypothetical protein RAJCM14343_1076 [Rhodococcus aetherivorans]CCW14056.1 hypothetical protein EBESD8_46210 [Rhodococcus aetherivorans]